MPVYDLTTGNMTINQINQKVVGIGERILFNALDDYAGYWSGTGITFTNDTTTVYEGKASLKMVIDATGNRNAQVSVPDIDKDWTAFNSFLLHLQANDATAITLRVRSSASDYNDYEITPTNDASFHDIWVNLASPTSTTGTPNMDAVNVVQLRGLVASKTYYVDKPSLLGKDDVLQTLYKKLGDPTSTSLPVGKSEYDSRGTEYTAGAGARTTGYRHLSTAESYMSSGSYGVSSIESNVERHGIQIESSLESGSYGVSSVQSNVQRHAVQMESSLESGSYGLSSTESNVERHGVRIESSVESGSYGSSSIESNVERHGVRVESTIESGTYGNSQLMSFVNNNGSFGNSSIQSNVQRHAVQMESSLESGSYGQSSLQSNIQRHGVQVESSLESATYGLSQIDSAVLDVRGTSQVLSEIDLCLNKSGSYSLSSVQSNVQRQAVQIESSLESGSYGSSSIESNVERHGVRVESSVESGTYGNSQINLNVDTESSNVLSAIAATKYAYQRSSYYIDGGSGNTIAVPKATWTTLRTYSPGTTYHWELRRLTIGIDSFVGSDVIDAVYRVDIQDSGATTQAYPYSASGETFTDAVEATLIDDGLVLNKGCSAIIKMYQNTADGISAIVNSIKNKAFYQQ